MDRSAAVLFLNVLPCTHRASNTQTNFVMTHPQAATDAQRLQAERAFLCRLLTGSAQVDIAAALLFSGWHWRGLYPLHNTTPSHRTFETHTG